MPDHFLCLDFTRRTAGIYNAIPPEQRTNRERQVINERFAYIADHINEYPEVRIKYFVPDERKSGGAIVEVSGKTCMM